MRFKQVRPAKSTSSYRQYSQTALTEAFLSVKEKNIPVARASRMYKVPMQTLRDRVLGKISIDTVTTGRAPVFNLQEEEKIVTQFKLLAKNGYGYTRLEVVDVANDYAIQSGKRTKDNPLKFHWFANFTKRWPEIKNLRPKSLEFLRAISKSSHVVEDYFDQLEEIFKKYSLHDKPHLIFNVDEKEVRPLETLPAIVGCKKATTPENGKTATIIGCGSAGGTVIPPFFVFAGKRLSPGLLKGSTPGAKGAMSDSGVSTCDIFRTYLKEHFIKHIPKRDSDQHLLLLLDGDTSHISLDLSEWAKSNNIILFILPAHISHVLQPLDIGCYDLFKRMFDDECYNLTRQTVTAVKKHDICQLSCKAYHKALSVENLQSAFRKAGVYPPDKSVISEQAKTPGEVVNMDDDVDESDDAEV